MARKKLVEIRIEYVPLSEIAKWPGNPKEHDDEVLDASIERFGFNDPVTIDERSRKLVEGHGRIGRLEARKAAGKPPPERILVREDGEWLVPVVRGVSFKSDAAAEAYVLAHNRTGEMGGWDPKLLSDSFARLRAQDADILGWSADYVDEIMREVDIAGEAAATPGQGSPWADPEADIRQIMFHFGEEFEQTIVRMQALMEAKGMVNHTELFLAMLDSYEQRKAAA